MTATETSFSKAYKTLSGHDGQAFMENVYASGFADHCQAKGTVENLLRPGHTFHTDYLDPYVVRGSFQFPDTIPVFQLSDDAWVLLTPFSFEKKSNGERVLSNALVHFNNDSLGIEQASLFLSITHTDLSLSDTPTLSHFTSDQAATVFQAMMDVHASLPKA